MSQTLLCGPDSPPYISWFEFSPLTHADNPFFFLHPNPVRVGAMR